MKKFKDLKVGDTVYKVIYTSNSSTPLRIQKEKVTAIEEIHSGAIIKTEEIVEEGTLHKIHGYFIDSCRYNANYIENDNTEIWWDKFVVQEMINNIAVLYQRKFTKMLNILKD